jgi:hypothetical protein
MTSARIATAQLDVDLPFPPRITAPLAFTRVLIEWSILVSL